MVYEDYYGHLLILGGARMNRRFNLRRRRKLILVERSITPPGTGHVDLYQFGRASTKVNNYVILDNKFRSTSTKNYRTDLSRYSFTLIGYPEVNKLYISRTAQDENGYIIFPKNDIFIMRLEKKHIWETIDTGEKAELSATSIIALPGVTLLWNATCQFSISASYTSLCSIDPCKHIVPKEVAHFWSTLEIPTFDYEAICPLCERKFKSSPGYSMVTAQMPIDQYTDLLYRFLP